MNGLAAKAVAIAAAAMLASCGGGSGATGGGSGGGAGAANATGASQQATGTTGGTPQQSTAALTLQFGAPGSGTAPSVQIGGSATLSAVLRDANGAPQPNTLVTFTPPAIVSLSPAVGTALSDANGVASIVVEGRERGAGVITAAATIAGTQVSTSLSFAVTPASSASGASASAPLSASVEFVGATKQTLNIAGTGSASTSDVSFRVRDQNGQPLANQLVTFTPTVTTGGLVLQPTSAITDAQGLARTTVTAGNAPTPVRINASTTVNGNPYAVQSLQLSVSSGNPTQKFFSVSAETLNVDGCEVDGVRTTVSARAGDQFGNPVPDGTTINFVTEGGRVGAGSIGSCQTSDGRCSVALESQEFRPRGQSPAWNNCRVSVLAYAVGQETFSDLNSNYRYDQGEPFDDLPDAFINTQPLVRNSPDPAYPWTSTGSSRNLAFGPVNFRAGADTLIKFTDSGQAVPVSDRAWGNAHVRGLVEIVFSGRSAQFCRPVPAGSPFTCQPIADLSLGACVPNQTMSATLSFVLADQNGNPLAFGSPVGVQGSPGITADAVSPAAVPDSNATSGSRHSTTVRFTPTSCGPSGTTTTVGTVSIKVTPAGSYEQSPPVPVNVVVNN